jgi:hypothetical protein
MPLGIGHSTAVGLIVTLRLLVLVTFFLYNVYELVLFIARFLTQSFLRS